MFSKLKVKKKLVAIKCCNAKFTEYRIKCSLQIFVDLQVTFPGHSKNFGKKYLDGFPIRFFFLYSLMQTKLKFM